MKTRLLATSPFLALAIAILALMAPRPAAPPCSEKAGVWDCSIPPDNTDAHRPLLPVRRLTMADEANSVTNSDNQRPRHAESPIVQHAVGLRPPLHIVPGESHLARRDRDYARRQENFVDAWANEDGNSEAVYGRSLAGGAGEPGLNFYSDANGLPPNSSERERLDPWHGYDSRNGPGNGY